MPRCLPGLIAWTLMNVAAAAADSPPQIPQNLDFRQGETGRIPPQWRMAGADRMAEIRRESCFPSPACAVILASPGPRVEETGVGLMQTVDAALYRGKSVRFAAWLRNRTDRAGSGAQLWLRINRRTRSTGLFDNVADRPVRSPEWSKSEIVLFIGTDAESLDFGVRSMSGDQVWVRDVSLDILAEGTESGTVPLAPENLDFADGEPGDVPPGWTTYPELAGYKAALSGDGCEIGPFCTTLFAPVKLPPEGFGALTQTVNAIAYRGKRVRFRAWVEFRPAEKGDHARLWLQDKTRMRYQEIRDAGWTRCDIIRTVDADSPTLSFGLMLFGKGSARIDGVFLQVIPDDQAQP